MSKAVIVGRKSDFERDIEDSLNRVDIQRKRILASIQNIKRQPLERGYLKPQHDVDFYFILLRRLYRVLEEKAREDSRAANLKGKYNNLYAKIKIRDHSEHWIDWKKFPSISPGSPIKVKLSVIINKSGNFVQSGNQKWDLEKDHKLFVELFEKLTKLYPFKKSLVKKVYLAGQANEYENDWKEKFKKLKGFEFYDWEFQSDQTSPDTYFPDDLKAAKNADILVANPGTAPSEATWIEIGYFLALNTREPGDTCKRLIIIWRVEREPKWSIEFVKKSGLVVSSINEAIKELKKLS